ncbi:hypothetical protein ACLQ2C_03420, partial [Streptomyces sp. DT73]
DRGGFNRDRDRGGFRRDERGGHRGSDRPFNRDRRDDRPGFRSGGHDRPGHDRPGHDRPYGRRDEHRGGGSFGRRDDKPRWKRNG